ncbi:MAG: RNA polymerase sigma factor RpoH [Paracoccaceae bacterium]
MSNNSLPALSEGGLSSYLNEIKKFPMLSLDEEFMLAKAWVDHDDRKSAHRLVTSHLRLAAKIALGYRGYGLPINEVVSEANVGLMQAVKRFDPDKGFRLATYAMWWIKASIQEYILRSWSLVKMGTTSAQKKLFFNLRKAKNKIGVMEDGDLRPENVKKIADTLHVSQQEVISMNRRMGGGDSSLNVLVNTNNEGTLEWQDWIEDENSDHATKFADQDELESRKKLLDCAMTSLNQREAEILRKRRLMDDPLTLEELSGEYNVSRERIRQIEVRAFEKLQKKMCELSEVEAVN